jgi:hypothetical protein
MTPTPLAHDFAWARNPGDIYTISPLNQDSPVDVGSWEIQTTVPEPESITLTFLGLVGIGPLVKAKLKNR